MPSIPGHWLPGALVAVDRPDLPVAVVINVEPCKQAGCTDPRHVGIDVVDPGGTRYGVTPSDVTLSATRPVSGQPARPVEPTFATYTLVGLAGEARTEGALRLILSDYGLTVTETSYRIASRALPEALRYAGAAERTLSERYGTLPEEGTADVNHPIDVITAQAPPEADEVATIKGIVERLQTAGNNLRRLDGALSDAEEAANMMDCTAWDLRAEVLIMAAQVELVAMRLTQTLADHVARGRVAVLLRDVGRVGDDHASVHDHAGSPSLPNVATLVAALSSWLEAGTPKEGTDPY